MIVRIYGVTKTGGRLSKKMKVPEHIKLCGEYYRWYTKELKTFIEEGELK